MNWSTLLLSSVFASGVYAAEVGTLDKKNFDISSVEVVQEQDYAAPLALVAPAPPRFECQSAPPEVLENEIDWSDVVRLGEQIWQLIANNRPVVNIQTPMVHVLPSGSDCWLDLEGWQGPQGVRYKIVYKNGYGMEVISAAFRVIYFSNGNLNDRGRFIANATVQPADVNVAWGFNLNAAVETGAVMNVGTLAQPIAGLPITIKWQTKTVVKDSQGSVNFFLTGDGRISTID